jgi:hypothetical protein
LALKLHRLRGLHPLSKRKGRKKNDKDAIGITLYFITGYLFQLQWNELETGAMEIKNVKIF